MKLQHDSNLQEEHAQIFAKFLLYADLYIRESHLYHRKEYLTEFIMSELLMGRKKASNIIEAVTDYRNYRRGFITQNSFDGYTIDRLHNQIAPNLNLTQPSNTSDLYKLGHAYHVKYNPLRKAADCVEGSDTPANRLAVSRSLGLLASSLDNNQEDISNERMDQPKKHKEFIEFLVYQGPDLGLTSRMFSKMKQTVHILNSKDMVIQIKHHRNMCISVWVQIAVLIVLLSLPKLLFNFFSYLRGLSIIPYGAIKAGKYYKDNLLNVSILMRLIIYGIFELIYNLIAYHISKKRQKE